MNISAPDLQFCIAQADIIAHYYSLNELGADSDIRDIGGLLRTCENVFGAKVRVCEVNIPEEDTLVRGMCVLSEGKKVEIALVKNLNECWKRFILCKELFHVALDRAEYRNINIAGHIEELTLAFPDDDSKPRKPVVVEFLAELGAMELLFPYGQRAKILSANPRPDFLEVAKRFMVPKAHAEVYLGQPYMENLGRFSKIGLT